MPNTPKTPQECIQNLRLLIDKVKTLAADETTDPEHLNQHMHEIEVGIKQLREAPQESWQAMREDIMGLSENLTSMQEALNTEYEKAKAELTTLEKRSQAEKAYAAYSQPKEEGK